MYIYLCVMLNRMYFVKSICLLTSLQCIIAENKSIWYFFTLISSSVVLFVDEEKSVLAVCTCSSAEVQ